VGDDTSGAVTDAKMSGTDRISADCDRAGTSWDEMLELGNGVPDLDR
jgi:hypothetical protein